LKQLVQGRDFLILVIGERGSGKTTMLNRFLDDNGENARGVRVQIQKSLEGENDTAFENLDGHIAYMIENGQLPVMILDDAHELNSAELSFLFQLAGAYGEEPRIKRIVLFCEPQIKTALSSLYGRITQKASINKLYMPPLTEEQTTAYLRHRLQESGFTGEDPFDFSHIKAINKASNGLPGRINEEARRLLKDRFSKKNSDAGSLWSTRGPKIRSSGLAASGIVALFLTGLLLFQSFPGPIFSTTDVYGTGGKDHFEKQTSPPAASSSSPGKKRAKIYGKKWLLAQNPSHYTLQILGVRRAETVLQIIENYRLHGRVAFYHTYHKAEDWYPLLYGIYSTREEALAAIGELDEEIRKSLPWARRLSTVHQQIRQSM